MLMGVGMMCERRRLKYRVVNQGERISEIGTLNDSITWYSTLGYMVDCRCR
jgi:hypothetical protein